MSPKGFPVSPPRWDRVHTNARYSGHTDSFRLTVSSRTGGISLELNPAEWTALVKAINSAGGQRINHTRAQALKEQ